MHIQINAQLLAATAIAQSIGDHRFYLEGVYLKGQNAAATNGHILTMAYDVDAMNDSDGAIMPVSKKAITALKNNKAKYAVFNGETLTVFDMYDAPTHIEQSKEIDGTFPDYARVIPGNTTESTTAHISNINLKKICDTANIFSKSVALSFSGADSSGPQIVRYDHIDAHIFSVAMPMRSDTRGLPNWYKSNEESQKGA